MAGSARKGTVTINEAIGSRIPRVRLPRWGQEAYLLLPLLPNGMHGPWAELYDEGVQEQFFNIQPGSKRIPHFVPLPLIGESEPDFEAYTGPVSPHESGRGDF